jgi:threonine dehydrogenase-like Zn-dependent dehydrogenase
MSRVGINSQLASSERRIVFHGEAQAVCEAFTPPACGAAQVQVRSESTLMSTGTELIALHRVFETGSQWDRWVRYPFYPGYACVGRIAALGSEVAGLRLGQRVCGRLPHASLHTVDAAALTAVPDGIDAQDACWFALAKIASMGLRAAAPSLSESVLVIGCGPIGQMVIRWLYASGITRIIALDPVEARLRLARDGGATDLVPVKVEDGLAALRQRGALPQVVIDCTGHHAVFAHALACAADRGRVIMLGDNGNPSKQHLTGDLIFRGLTIRGAHDSDETSDWNAALIHDIFFRLHRSGRFPLAGLGTNRFAPEQCAAAYAFAREHRSDTMGIFFDWNHMP